MYQKYDIEELIVRYLQQEISEDEVRALNTWLEQSPENKAYFFQLKSISDLSCKTSLLNEDENESSWQRMHLRLQNVSFKSSSSAEKERKLWHILLRYAAIVLIMLSVGWRIGEYSKERELSELATKEVTYNEIRVQKGGRANTVILSDGTKVVLNAGTTFKYPTVFCSKDRQVFLNGEAYFDVAKKTDKPFIVHLKRQHITVLGTTFNIEAYEGEPYSIVTLSSGSVALEAFNETGESMSRMFLKPNQSACSDNQTGSVSIKNTDVSLANSWMRGEYKFKDESLYSIARRLENYYDIKIHIDHDDLKRTKYTGTFSLDQSIQEVLRIIDHDRLFVFKRVGKDIFIEKNKK